MGEGLYENCFATSGNLFCTCHLEKRGGWMVMGQVGMFIEKKGGARKYSATPGIFLQLWVPTHKPKILASPPQESLCKTLESISGTTVCYSLSKECQQVQIVSMISVTEDDGGVLHLEDSQARMLCVVQDLVAQCKRQRETAAARCHSQFA